MNGMGHEKGRGGMICNECQVMAPASLSTVAITQVIFVCKRQVMQGEARSGGRSVQE